MKGKLTIAKLRKAKKILMNDRGRPRDYYFMNNDGGIGFKRVKSNARRS